MRDTSDLLGSMSRRKLLAMSGMTAVAAGASPGSVMAATGRSPGAGAPLSGGPPSDPALPWPARAKFGGKAVIGPHRSSALAMVDDRPLFGLPRERTFFYGCVRDAEGNIYEIVRGIPGKGFGGLDRLFIQSSAGKETLRIAPEMMAAAAASTNSVGRIEDGIAVWTRAPDVPGKDFRITASADGSRATWFEEGVFDLTGELLGPGLQWHIPDADGSELYVSQIYELRGTLNGKTVRGIGGLDQSYLPEGQLMYSGKDPLFRADAHHRCWYTWATRYVDGSYDCGHFVLGTDRIGFALLTDEKGELTLDTDVRGTVELWQGQIWPRTITIHTKTGDWEFLPDPKGRMVDLLGNIQSFTPQNEGRWRKVGDTRKPAAWFAWGEVQSAAKIGYSQSTRF